MGAADQRGHVPGAHRYPNTPTFMNDFLTKTQLAAVLTATKRTLTNHVRAGVLSQPTRFGRDVGWSTASLLALLNADAGPSPGPFASLSAGKRKSLREALEGQHARLVNVKEVRSAGEVLESSVAQGQVLPEPVFVDPSLCQETDLRPMVIQQLQRSREVVTLVRSQAFQAPKRSFERDECFQELEFYRDQVDDAQDYLATGFVHMHSPDQLIGSRDIFSSPIFNVRKNAQRTSRVDLALTMTDGTTIQYEGPELRQSDGLVFMALLNIARDVRVGKSVGFSPCELCQSLWGYYDGKARKRLKGMILRLQEALLHFPTFRVQLVQRFDFPRQGHWTVCLDADIVKLITSRTVVWLDLNQRLSIACGLTSWLYGYIRSQRSLIPTKVARLHALSGSDGALQGFRESLRASMGLLATARLVDTGWYIDKHDMLRWQKVGA